MKRRYKFSITLLIVLVILLLVASGCRPDPVEVGLDEEQIMEAEGFLVGQIDNHSVEIEIAGSPRVFRLDEGLQLTGVNDGDRVSITYIEPVDHQEDEPFDPRPLLLSITAVDLPLEVMESEGYYVGQIDSHSVEIEINGVAEVFSLAEGVFVDHLDSGSLVSFTYRRDGERKQLLAIELLSGLPGDGNNQLVGEGTLIGLIDAQSVEIRINRAFALDQEVSVEDIEDGSLVVFAFRETGLRATIETIRAVEQPVEGDVMHGTFIGQIDSQSIEIEYFQAFALGSSINLDEIEDGAEIIFTYLPGEHRPLLTSIRVK
jgi:hypothetical protein